MLDSVSAIFLPSGNLPLPARDREKKEIFQMYHSMALEKIKIIRVDDDYDGQWAVFFFIYEFFRIDIEMI